MQTESERIKNVINHFCASKAEFARIMEERPQTISNWVARGAGKAVLNKILAKFPHINANWLLTGEGEMLKEQHNKSTAKMLGGVYAASDGDDSLLSVDYIPVSARASFIENLYIPSPDEKEKISFVPRNGEREQADMLKVFEVEGDSMLPTISSGALILVKEIPEQSWHTAEGVVVVVFSEFVTVKRVHRNEILTNNCLLLESDNRPFGNMTVALSDIRAIFKAKRIISQDII